MRASRTNAMMIGDKRLLSVKELCSYTGRGRNQATAWGREIGAAVQFGKRVFFDRHVVDGEIDKLIAINKRTNVQ